MVSGVWSGFAKWFKFALEDGAVAASAGMGFYSKVDLGIAKYHFELGAGRENFRWK